MLCLAAFLHTYDLCSPHQVYFCTHAGNWNEERLLVNPPEALPRFTHAEQALLRAARPDIIFVNYFSGELQGPVLEQICLQGWGCGRCTRHCRRPCGEC